MNNFHNLSTGVNPNAVVDGLCFRVGVVGQPLRGSLSGKTPGINKQQSN